MPRDLSVMEQDIANRDDSLEESSGSNLSSALKALLNSLDLSSEVLVQKDITRQNKSLTSAVKVGSIHQLTTDEKFCPTIDIDRKTVLEGIRAAKAAAKIYSTQNDFFHSQLVEHFKRKQMTWAFEVAVFGQDHLSSKYLKKLNKYERLRQEIETAAEYSKAESTLLRGELHKKNDVADSAVDDLTSKEREIGGLAYVNGKAIPAKDIQAMITRQVGKMKEIAKTRIQYTRLRDCLHEKEIILENLKSRGPQLNRKVYERLEAERAYYDRTLRESGNQVECLRRKHGHIFRRLKMMRQKHTILSREIQNLSERLLEQRGEIKKGAWETLVRRETIKRVQHCIDCLQRVLRLPVNSNILIKIRDSSNEHGRWFDKVAATIKEIRTNDESLENLRANLFLHSGVPMSDDEESDDIDFGAARFRLPPLGGGFLQVLEHHR